MVFADPPGLPSAAEARINDLTLKVTSPSAAVYWGNYGLLDGNWSVTGGSANTVDTVENVFIQNPEPGLWTIEVIASEVVEDGHVETPELDADFALVVSGAQVATCSSEGRVLLNRVKYPCDGTANIRVSDCDLNTDELVIETATVTVESDTEPGGETVLLTETGENTADFRGSISLDVVDAPDVLHVADGDTVTVTYIDADNGLGGYNVPVTDTAVVDCVPPVISNVQVADIGPFSAVVTFDTDEAARGTVHYGLSCASLTETAAGSGYATSPTVSLTGLAENTTYFYTVDAEDEAGNSVTDDNGGSCYSFSTPDIPDYFSEQFATGTDLDGYSLLLTPNGSGDFYAACIEPITALPTDPSGGTPITSFSPSSDDGSAEVTLTGGSTVSVYGVSYGSFFAGTNGYVTFTAGDNDYTETFDDHFNLPRISVVFDDLNPGSGGAISWKQLADRAVVTYDGVFEYGTSDPNTFQIEMFFDGRIQVSWLGIASGDHIAGISGGGGTPAGFYESDLSGVGGCGAYPPTANSAAVQTPTDTPIDITLTASDDGLPDPPAALTYIITSLPSNGELADPGAGLIDTVPYTLAAGGNMVNYAPVSWYGGPDSFTFKANDGGSPPDGGDSNIATISITVGGPQAVYVFPMDTDPGWSISGGEWAFGQPTGQGGANGDPDPTAGHTGDNVYGYNLDGDYTGGMPVYYLTTTALDCSSVAGTELRFWRWLGVEASVYDHASIDVSPDQTNWTNVWEHSGVTISDGAWVEQTYDISSVADGESDVFIRWGMGTTDVSWNYCGWNIDDVEIWGVVSIEPPLFDCDGDDTFDLALDLPCFVDALLGIDTAPPGGIDRSDINDDGFTNGADVQAFVDLLVS